MKNLNLHRERLVLNGGNCRTLMCALGVVEGGAGWKIGEDAATKSFLFVLAGSLFISQNLTYKIDAIECGSRLLIKS